MRARIFFLCVVSAGAAAGCEDSSVNPITAPISLDDSGTPNDAAPPDGSASCSEGAQLTCVCVDAGTGRQRCSGGRYGVCEGCTTSDATQAKCVAGNYKGIGEGMASSRAGSFLGFRFTTPSKGNWSFSLAASGSSEFFSVGNGCVHFLDPMTGMDDPRARFYIGGSVSCSSGQLNGEIKGFYTATPIEDPLGGAKRFFYKGTLTGTFDPVSQSFSRGEYAYKEPKTDTSEPPHGEGTWNAKLTTETVANESEEECLMGRFPSEEFE